MNAEKFLKDSNLSNVANGDTLGLKVVHEDDVTYLMEKYHQSKINNVALDDVIKREILKDFQDNVSRESYDWDKGQDYIDAL